MELQDAVYISFGLLLIAMFISMARIIKGPDIKNRAVAMDLLASIVMGFILLYAIQVKIPVYLDAVIVISLVSFIGTLSISTYLKS